MDWISSALSSTGLGSIIGLVGGFASKYIDLKSIKYKNEHEAVMREFDLAESKQERSHEILMAHKQIERAQVEGSIVVEGKSIDAFSASQSNSKVEGVLSFVRPIVTAYLLIASTALFITVWRKIGGLDNVSAEYIMSLLTTMIDACIFLTVTCVSWWFGSRGGNLVKQK